ncbi:hypothetical protein J2S49_000986 [Arcanobacterium wilhelmae]|uniref:Glucose-inhibited division protein B n=1 Tax=Arcanobacterium wilhelmae TaxID=1803177 RepID=A0ABT9NBM9_9ACTO|nr:RsmG family class I SAM-dependent methyltransferase [Arcanobacterium wilhelmae]MDP9800910.1 hypothetical protein [Arcanobacterium wilhelmae]WFN90273.1 class I SAM-dependent methyltransferase [Arcanobacterium wilhelmae]
MDERPIVVERAPQGGAEHFGSSVWANLVRFSELLEDEGQLRGLVGPREMDKLWTRHILNSTAINSFIEESTTVADVVLALGFLGSFWRSLAQAFMLI